MAEFLSSVTELAIDQITEAQRLRPVSDIAVTALVEVIEKYGFTSPIAVRRTRDGFTLIDGAHRLEAMRRLGASTIPVRAFRVTNDEASGMEIAGNLATGRMSPLDDAVFLAKWQEIYLREHPETKRGTAGALGRWDQMQGNCSSFASIVAEGWNVSPRQIRKIISAGRALDEAEVRRLRDRKDPLSFVDVTQIGRIGADDERAFVVEELAAGRAKKAAEARKTWKAREQGSEAPEQDPVEEGFEALEKVWTRVSVAAQRRFVDQHATILAQLLREARK